TAVPNGAPYTGAFNPASSLGVLRGTPVSGAWRLHIADNVSGDEGELQAWSLDICGFTSYRVYLPFIRR
ncbi:MAG: proprotein convertase P-domain-containing protein, partial [Anaerolineales bacterium]|nr:proprotein convertase P-domain-containing protein [Anaerolineales bacterium]